MIQLGDHWCSPFSIQGLKQTIFFPGWQVREVVFRWHSFNPDIRPVAQTVAPNLVDQLTMIPRGCCSLSTCRFRTSVVRKYYNVPSTSFTGRRGQTKSDRSDFQCHDLIIRSPLKFLHQILSRCAVSIHAAAIHEQHCRTMGWGTRSINHQVHWW